MSEGRPCRSRLRRRGAAPVWAALAGLLAAARPAEAADAARQLAAQLDAQGDHAAAAIEYRRLALDPAESAGRGAAYWLAAYEYWRDDRPPAARRMLERAEEAAPELRPAGLLLRGETAAAERRWSEAGFFFETAAEGAAGAQERFLRRRAAEMWLRAGDPAAAEESLRRAAPPEAAGLDALAAYRRGRDKSPRLGGLLGLLPGLGYAYAGEYANATRSLILNGLFGYGMWSTAREEQWGAFGVITFFEFTWYSGSIYGGVDAAHRYNRERLEAAAATVRGDAAFAPNLEAWPLLRLDFRF